MKLVLGSLCVAVVASLSFAAAVRALQVSTERDRIRETIASFGSRDPRARDDAAQRLIAIGSSAITALREAFEKDADPEIRLRAERLLAEIPIPQDMVFVPAGEFEAGTDREGADNPKRRATTGAFWTDRYEVTNDQFANFVRATHRSADRPGWNEGQYPRGTANLPVVYVSFEDAKAYAEWAGKRLPTELEWEKVARGIDGRTYPWGSDFVVGRANLASGRPCVVGSHAGDVSPFGCFDLEGNVSEWVIVDSSDMSPEDAMVRGGSFDLSSETYADLATRHNRKGHRPGGQPDCGFRCVRDLKPGETPPR